MSTRRVAVVDIGTNSTRLLIADVDPATKRVTERDRRTTVTRLGQGVDHTGVLADEAMERVRRALTDYKKAIDDNNVDVTTGVLTSAVRDARNGAEFTAAINDTYNINARTITGDEEARLTYLGATDGRAGAEDAKRVVVDVGGGSTELVVGHGARVDFHVSTQAGVVRQTERFLRTDPPRPEELQQLQAEANEIFTAAVPHATRQAVQQGIAVAGTATSCAAILQDLDPYDPTKVHGFRLLRAQCEMLLPRLAAMTTEQRRHVTGLHPDRAPAIVAGVILLIEAMRCFDLTEVEVSEHDILRGAALDRAAASAE
ncbi:MAG TPA: Ppx/GppA family phosphatase [Baekduia sp.]|uniref:Ppx/GppA phosphatase family protein n=1 Tax=Baekduia sp. TaxID=2600305 RepID=UPI002D781E1E|nr:Ppx/GppA family phosphatase [Baekduia sp.]HET6506924.1 Ppx/GppA family phosphatase [Baekduia sp.]